MLKPIINLNKLFYCFIVVFIFSLVCMGYNTSDGGFIFGSSYRITRGQTAYKDFFYVRPPLTIYIYALFIQLFGNFAYIVSRFFSYFELVLANTLIVYLFRDKFRDSSNWWLLASISLVLSVWSFPPMAWHSVDGVFFSFLGIVFLFLYQDNNKAYYLIFSVLLFFLSVLCKQSFYLMPVFSVLYVWQTTPRKYHVLGLICITYCVLGLLFLGVLSYFNMIKFFLENTTGQTKLNDFFQVGVFNFFRLKIILVALILYIMGRKWNILFLIGLLISVTTLISISHINLRYTISDSDLYSILFVLSIILLFNTPRSQSKYKLILLLTLNWSSCISWGMAYPELFSCSLVLVIAFYQSELYTKNLKITTLSFICVFVLLNIFTSYRDEPKLNLRYSLANLYPKAQFIFTSKKHYEHESLLKSLYLRFNCQIILPVNTTFYYFNNVINPAPIDWFYDKEYTVKGGEQIIVQIEKTNCTIVDLSNRHLLETSPLTRYVLHSGKFKLIYSEEALRVYKPI